VADVSKWTYSLRAENLSHTFERDDSCVVGCLLKDAQAVATRLRSLDAPGQRRARRIPFRLICSKPNRSARTPWSAVLWPINQFLPSCKWLSFLPPQSGQPFRCEPFLVRLRTCGPIHELGPRVVADGLLRDHDVDNSSAKQYGVSIAWSPTCDRNQRQLELLGGHSFLLCDSVRLVAPRLWFSVGVPLSLAFRSAISL